MKIIKVIQEYFELICMPNTNVFDIVVLVYIDNTSRANDQAHDLFLTLFLDHNFNIWTRPAS